MSAGPRWRTTGRFGAAAATLGVVVLAGAAGVLAADAAGLLSARGADAATVVAAVTPGATSATGSVGTGTRTPTTTATATTLGYRQPATTSAGKPSRHLTPTLLDHLPLQGVANGAAGVAIGLNGTPAPDTPRPEIFPHIAGSWRNIGPFEAFKPVSTLEPCSSYTMLVPTKTIAVGHRELGHTRTFSFKVACPGIAAVQDALARLGYLPYTLHGFIGASSTGRITRARAAERAFEPPANGVLLANEPDAPPLQSGTLDATTTGAMEVFEEDHNLPTSIVPSSQLWVDLLADETIAHRDPQPYTWVTVTETLPETLEVHENAKIALSSPANTGVPGATTQQGIFPIYVRYVSTMIGTNVDGTHYDDPGVPWVNYFNGGDAVHGYPRPGYGYPQSNGCVELPIPTAEVVYGMLQVGDLVIVE